MRPTLIQQKPVFGQEPVVGVQPVRELSNAALYTIVGFSGFVGIFCTRQLMDCGLAHGLGRLECFLNLLPYLFAFVFLLLICGPKPRGGKWTHPTHVPWVGLMGIAALLLGIYLLPQFVTRNRRPWLIPGPAPAARTNPHALPTMTGTWRGHFGVDSDPALLVVESQDGPEFRGTLLERDSGYTAKIAVIGDLDLSGSVGIQEIRVLDEPYYHDWALGADTGSFSPDALEIHGTGVDTRDSRYHWDFEHVSSAVYIPETGKLIPLGLLRQ